MFTMLGRKMDSAETQERPKPNESEDSPLEDDDLPF